MMLASPILGEPIGLGFVAAGGIATLVVTAGPRWPEARAFGLGAAWLSLLLHRAPDQDTGTRWLAVAVTIVLPGVPWWQHRAPGRLRWPAVDSLTDRTEPLLFLVSPFALCL